MRLRHATIQFISSLRDARSSTSAECRAGIRIIRVRDSPCCDIRPNYTHVRTHAIEHAAAAGTRLARGFVSLRLDLDVP